MKREYIILDKLTRLPVKDIHIKPSELHLLKRGRSIKEKLGITGFMLILILGVLLIYIKHEDNINKSHESELNQIQYELLVAQRIQTEGNIYPIIGLYSSIGATKIPKDSNIIYEFIKTIGAWYPDIIMSQCIMESSLGTSNLARKSNNLFGMKKVSIENPSKKHRATTQLPNVNQNGYGKYLNWQMSVIDRVLWDLNIFPNKKPTRQQYINTIKKYYAEDPEYINKINVISKKYINK